MPIKSQQANSLFKYCKCKYENKTLPNINYYITITGDTEGTNLK